MAEPTFVSAGAYLAGSGSSAAVAVPSGTAAGRVAIVTIFLDGAAIAVTPPAGFAAAEGSPSQIASGAGAHSLHVFWKRLTGADTGTYDFSWGTSRYREAIACLYDGVISTGTPFDSPTDTAQELTNSTVTPPVSITTLGADRRLIWAGSNWAGGTWIAPSSPAGFVKRAQGGAGAFTICDAPFLTAGATGDVTGTCTGSDKRCAWLGALIGTTSDTPVSLSDSGGAADGLAATAAAPLAEAATASDGAAVSVSAALADEGAGSDTLTASAAVPLADDATAADAISAGLPATLADSGTAGDLITPLAEVTLADAATGIEALTVTAEVALGEVGAAGDTAAGMLIHPKAITDSGAAADALTYVIDRDIGPVGRPHRAWHVRPPRRGMAGTGPRT